MPFKMTRLTLFVGAIMDAHLVWSKQYLKPIHICLHLVHFFRWVPRFSYQKFKPNKIKRKAFSFGTENKNMAEPTTSTTVAITASAGLVSLLPFVNGDALFGAVIGAAFLAFTQESLSYGKRIFSLMLSVALGYALAPEISNRTGINSHTVIACFTSMFALPVLVKVMSWVNKSTLTEIFNTTSKFFSALSNTFGKENKK